MKKSRVCQGRHRSLYGVKKRREEREREKKDSWRVQILAFFPCCARKIYSDSVCVDRSIS